MGKQAKKKDKSDAQKASQHRHNRNTRGTCSSKRGALWDVRHRTSKDEDGNKILVKEEVRVPPDTLWAPEDKARNHPNAHEPFDHLSLDWQEELTHYALSYEGGKVGSMPLGNGQFAHRVYVGDSIRNPKFLLLEVISSTRLFSEKTKRKRKKS